MRKEIQEMKKEGKKKRKRQCVFQGRIAMKGNLEKKSDYGMKFLKKEGEGRKVNYLKPLCGT